MQTIGSIGPTPKKDSNLATRAVPDMNYLRLLSEPAVYMSALQNICTKRYTSS